MALILMLGFISGIFNSDLQIYRVSKYALVVSNVKIALQTNIDLCQTGII